MIYFIPYRLRYTEIGKFNHQWTFMDIDGKGLLVKHDRDQDLDLDFIKRHLVGLDDQKVAWVDADNPKQALEKLFDEWKGFKVGTTVMARELSKRTPIIEYPSCKDAVEMEHSGHIGCAKGEWSGKLSSKKKSYCGCILDGYVRPLNCPVGNDKDIMDIAWVEKEIDGYVFRRSIARKDFGIKTRGMTDAKANTIVLDLHKQEVLNSLSEKDPKKFNIDVVLEKVSKLEEVVKDINNPDRFR